MLNLPDKILLENFNGDWVQFENAVYEVFCKDFVYSQPIYNGTKLGLKKHPLKDGKEYTFWHFISSGEDEQNRLHDIERMERISWPKPIIESSEDSNILVWQNKRNNETRILLWLQNQDYLVVLAERKGYILPWTAYLVKEKNRKAKLQKEYETYINAKTAQL